MADWVWVESPGTSVEQEPRVRAAQFGDGYQQRAPDGINTQPQSWSLAFNDVGDETAADMVAFLRAQGGVLAFNYVPMWATAAIRVVCPSWRRTLGSQVGTSNVTATFDQVFEP